MLPEVIRKGKGVLVNAKPGLETFMNENLKVNQHKSHITTRKVDFNLGSLSDLLENLRRRNGREQQKKTNLGRAAANDDSE